MGENWRIVKLGDCVKTNLSYGLNAPAMAYVPGMPKYIRITDISDDGKYMMDDIVAADSEDTSDYQLGLGDIVLARTGASTGKSYLYRESDGEMVYAGFLIKASINDKEYNPNFVFYVLHTGDFYNWVNTTSVRSGQPGINSKEYASFSFNCPSKKEQDQIAQVLCNLDEAILWLDKLIDKKKNIKIGAMQDLLSGRRRLNGNKDKWVKKKISEVLTIGHGQSQHEVEDEFGTYEILATGGVIGHTNAYLWDKPSVLIGRKGTIDKPQYVDRPFWTIDTLFYTKINEGYNAKFLYYLFLMIPWREYNEASGVPSLSSKTIGNIEIVIPEKKEEQDAIERVLSDIDIEIDDLIKKREKYTAIRQGMMQELLTGKIRLI